MEWLTKLMAARCDNCPLCRHARREPDSWFGKLMAFHGRFCPFWHSWEKVHGGRDGRADAARPS
jgi:hypothetical protein